MVTRHHAVAALIMLSIASNAFAQGIDIMPTPSRPSPDTWDNPSDPRAHRPDDTLYRYGQEIYAVKLGCRTCPLADKPLDEVTARRYFNEDALRADLTDKEDYAVRKYLSGMFPTVY